jgi:hypothetical protein
MARSMLGSAVSKAAAAASDEMSLLMGVQKEIWYVRPSVRLRRRYSRLVASCSFEFLASSLVVFKLSFVSP